MIRTGGLSYILGQFLVVLGGSMLPPLALCLVAGEAPAPFLLAGSVTAGLGAVLLVVCPRPARDLSQREGLLLVLVVWLSVGLFGCLPFLFSPDFAGFTDAFFEATSGFTTTGATILAEVERLPRGLQLWRCLTHWLGGMGIVLLGIAVLPLLGVGGMPLYRAEFSGARSEKLKPRITETALALWKIYVALTLLELLALRGAGMGWFDALCHSFSTLGTGGFSTRTASIEAFDSPLIEAIIVVFMFLAGANFTLHYRLWVERRAGRVLRDVELRFYSLAILAATAVISVSLVALNGYEPLRAVRSALFQVTSILTTTGFATDDFEAWRPLPQLMFLAMMFTGGCTGSTAGGLKASRILLLLKVVSREFKRMVERRGIFAIRLGDRVIPEETIRSLLSLVYLAFLVNFAACLLLAASGVDVLTSIAAVAASMFNVGPGLGSVGPTENYAHLPALAKWVLSFCMIAGRLEFYTVLVIVSPAFWRK